MNKSRVCLIGGAGFIGSSLIDPLLNTGREVHVVDIKPLAVARNDVKYYKLNIQNPVELIDMLKVMDEMIYLAHDGFPALHSTDPEHEIKANIFFTVQLFRQLHQTALKKIIYFSSGGAVYGHTRKLKLKETDETVPVSSYGIAKLAVEKYIRIFHQSNKLPVICVRPSNVYGPGQLPFKGQGFIATAIKLVQQRKPVAVYGKEGTIRDYLFIDDIVAAIVGLLNKGKAGETYNIGTGIGHSNMDILNMIGHVALKNDIEIQIKTEPERPFDVNYNVLDSKKLMKTIHWQPRVELYSGIELTWNWLSERYNEES